uniref:Dolichyl-diphosphooligosaccharide--protein glycosyltransferase subunit 2 n=1 Tax=Picea sitchensis TaxID=3332 RepID=D5AAK3_PICSI|nr:unknown [Picea sitchensis]
MFTPQMVTDQILKQSLGGTYKALKSFRVLGIEAKNSGQPCQLAFEALKFSSAQIKDIFYALKITRTLKCPMMVIFQCLLAFASLVLNTYVIDIVWKFSRHHCLIVLMLRWPVFWRASCKKCYHT